MDSHPEEFCPPYNEQGQLTDTPTRWRKEVTYVFADSQEHIKSVFPEEERDAVRQKLRQIKADSFAAHVLKKIATAYTEETPDEKAHTRDRLYAEKTMDPYDMQGATARYAGDTIQRAPL